MNVFPVAVFPPVQYFVELINAERVVVDTCEHYVKQSIRNRYEILGPNGRQKLTVPVQHGRRPGTPVSAIKLSFVEPWMDIHAKSIMTAYNSSPFFLYYQDEVEALLRNPETDLLSYNLYVLKGLMDLLEIDKNIELSSSYVEDADKDLRAVLHKKTASIQIPSYHQVFSDRHAFEPNLSVLDLLFNEGPSSLTYLESLSCISL